jgi:MFS family permease
MVTILTRLHGMHIPMLIGVFLQTLGFNCASFSRRIWHLYLTQGVLVGCGVGWTYIPTIAIISQWFSRRRSLANGITGAGSGIGGLIFSFATRVMIGNLSLAWSLRIIGVVSGVMNLMGTALIRSRNKEIQPRQHGFDVALLKRYDVLLLLSWSFVSMLGYIVILYSMSDFARSIGLDNDRDAAVTAFLNLGTALGRPFIGVLSDRFGRIETAGMITFVCGLSLFAVWIPATNYGVTVFFAIVNGGILGVFWVVCLHFSVISRQ